MVENSLSTEARERSQPGMGGWRIACNSSYRSRSPAPAPSRAALRPDDKAQNVIPEPTPRPDAKAAIALICSGLLQGWNQCLLTASNTCGSKGYTILDRSDQNPTQPNESTFTRSMHIRC